MSWHRVPKLEGHVVKSRWEGILHSPKGPERQVCEKSGGELQYSPKSDVIGDGGPFNLGVPSQFFPGTLLSKKPPQTLGKQLVFEMNGI